MGQSSRVSRLVRRVVAVDSSRAHLGPLLRRLIVTFFILQQLLRDAPDERIVRIRIRQQRADGEQDLGDGERGRPLLLQDVQANLPRTVDVAVIDSRSKRNFRRFERVIRWKLNVKKKYTILIGRSCARCRDGTPSDRSAFDSNGEEGRARLRVVFVSPHAPVGPTMVDTHSYKLSPFGPALQFVGGSSEISANSFWMRLALLDSELFFSLIRPSLASSPSFLPSFLRSFGGVPRVRLASRVSSRVVSSRVASRLVSSRLGRRLRASHTHVETTTTGRRQFKVIIIIQINLQTNEDEPKTKTNTQSVERGGAGVNPTFGVCLRLI